MELQLKNIGMIKEANVKIDGLTLIAGENDTGKSTVGKGLYSIIKFYKTIFKKRRDNLWNDYEHIFNEVYKSDFNHINLKIDSFEMKYGEFIWELPKQYQLLDVIFIESPLVWNFTDFFRDIAQVESQMNIKLDYPYLMKDLNFKLHIKSASSGLDIKDEMIDLMGGEFKKDDLGRYYFDKQGMKIDLVNTATGIKYFGIFQILSQNKYLNENTVLILDEPEVHLHPKWQLEMAKVIVELVKNGVKIVVNSHSPYMIEALELYAKKYEINSHFYLSEKVDDMAEIRDVSDNLEPIYKKLAMAIDSLEKISLENFKW